MYELIVIGSSAGGIEAVMSILSGLPDNFKLPIVLVQHQDAHAISYLREIFAKRFTFTFVDVEDKLFIEPCKIYIAPAGYHVQIEADKAFSLSVDEPVHYSRPSIDVLFASAAEVYKSALIGVLLTGANADGAAGLKIIQQNGGYVMVQDPKTALAAEMPISGIKATATKHIYSPDNISKCLLKVVQGEKKYE